MFYLNNPWLTSQGIIAAFKKKCMPLQKTVSESNSQLTVLKTKLKDNFFQDFKGCHLRLSTVPPGPVDRNATTPVIIKQKDQYFLYAPSTKANWTLTKLNQNFNEHLDFPAVETNALLPYNSQYQPVYEAIASKSRNIVMNHHTQANIHLKEWPNDRDIRIILEKDNRFISNYPLLKQVLKTIFSLNDQDDPTPAIHRLEAMTLCDWTMRHARSQFDQLNTKYSFFSPATEMQFELFTKLASACRNMLVLFELNNDPSDLMAYDYAYKIMALFVDPSAPSTRETLFDQISRKVFHFLNANDDDKSHPFHDAFVTKLPELPHGASLHDLAGWRQLINKQGVFALPFFMMSQAIEKKIAEQAGEAGPRAPKTLAEAQKIAALCAYPRSFEDKEFALLCYKNKVPEKTFDACLNFIGNPPKWPKKDTDAIPKITIEEPDSGYVWTKLSVDDKRGLILGKMTDCCQSIGDHSNLCVQDAVTRHNNGLYVLLKRKNFKFRSCLNVDGRINYESFQIIGQSYVWKTIAGNLCLDSVECLNLKKSVEICDNPALH